MVWERMREMVDKERSIWKKEWPCCWVCKGRMTSTSDKNVLRCSNAVCSGGRPRDLAIYFFVFVTASNNNNPSPAKSSRPGLNQWKTAWSPFGARAQGGHNLEPHKFLQATYCAALRIPQDATVHLIGKSAEYVAEVCRQVRFVCAWKQMQMSLETELPDGIVEWDSTRTAVKRKKDKRVLKASAKARMKRPAAVRKKPASSVAVHSGRLLLGTHRGSDKKLVLPLPPKSTSSKAPGPPETVEEVYPWIASKTNAKRHVVGSDSSKGLQGACQRLNLPQAQARHSLSEYTPVQTLLLKDIAKRALKKMRGSYQTKGKKMQMVGGDQKCEALAGQIKASMRRAGKLGRAAADSSGEHLDPLSLYFLSVHPGLDSVISAFREYMTWCKGRLAPKDAYHDTSWLMHKPPEWGKKKSGVFETHGKKKYIQPKQEIRKQRTMKQGPTPTCTSHTSNVPCVHMNTPAAYHDY